MGWWSQKKNCKIFSNYNLCVKNDGDHYFTNFIIYYKIFENGVYLYIVKNNYTRFLFHILILPFVKKSFPFSWQIPHKIYYLKLK
jgi:hypothetical protein